jgi:hypothetical protein
MWQACGAIGTFCTNCEDSGLIYDMVDANDDQCLGDDKDGKVGRCPVCGKYGALDTLCTNCEDSGLIYNTFYPRDMVLLGLEESESDKKSRDEDE